MRIVCFPTSCSRCPPMRTPLLAPCSVLSCPAYPGRVLQGIQSPTAPPCYLLRVAAKSQGHGLLWLCLCCFLLSWSLNSPQAAFREHSLPPSDNSYLTLTSANLPELLCHSAYTQFLLPSLAFYFTLDLRICLFVVCDVESVSLHMNESSLRVRVFRNMRGCLLRFLSV